jgi:hypothetical protein
VWLVWWIGVVFGRGLVVGFAVFGAGNAVSSALRALDFVEALCGSGLLFVCLKW